MGGQGSRKLSTPQWYCPLAAIRIRVQPVPIADPENQVRTIYRDPNSPTLPP